MYNVKVSPIAYCHWEETWHLCMNLKVRSSRPRRHRAELEAKPRLLGSGSKIIIWQARILLSNQTNNKASLGNIYIYIFVPVYIYTCSCIYIYI